MVHHTRIVAIGAVVALLAGCSEPPTNTSPPISARRDKNPMDVPAVRMDLPPKPRAWDTSDDALVAAIAEESGHAVVAFKEPGSGRALTTGLRAAVSAGTVTAGLNRLRALGVQIVDFYDAMGAAHVTMPPSLAPVIRASPLVDYIEPRQWGRVEGVPGMNILAFLPLGTAQSVPWGIQLVRAPDAWTMTRGTGARIYLIDTGIDTTHEDLPHPPASHCAGASTGCEDAYPIPHGTHVMGIWTARDNTVGVVGVAPGVNASDVYVWGACANDGSCSTTDVTNGLNAAIFDADVINLSLSLPYDAAQANAVALDWSYNIVLVAAAGNNGGNTIVYPANYTHVIGVSGVLPDKSFASTSPCAGASSNWGSHVDLAAPFYALSTVPGGYDDETGTPPWCGTSMATPHVSGAAALLRAQNPTWTNQQIVDRLFATARDLGTTGWDQYYGNGLVDATYALGGPPPPRPTVVISGPTNVRPGATCTWFANVSGGTPPYVSYAWFPLGNNSSELTYTNTGQSFNVSVWVTDADGAKGYDDQPVTVSPTAPACFS
jgi:subtilisin family serine protease